MLLLLVKLFISVFFSGLKSIYKKNTVQIRDELSKIRAHVKQSEIVLQIFLIKSSAEHGFYHLQKKNYIAQIIGQMYRSVSPITASAPPSPPEGPLSEGTLSPLRAAVGTTATEAAAGPGKGQ